MFQLKKTEAWLLTAGLGLLSLAVFGPGLAQPAHLHDFADPRVWAGLPFAMDVLSNLPFALWGLSGLVLLFKGWGVLATCPALRVQTLPVAWLAVIAVYALAKLLEVADHALFEWTGHLVSGHSLKHVVASFAAWPVSAAVSQQMASRAGVKCEFWQRPWQLRAEFARASQSRQQPATWASADRANTATNPNRSPA